MNDDSLLQEDIPQNISDLLPRFQHIASQPLGDCEKSYFYAMTKKGYSNNELIFIISHLLSLLTNGNTKEHKKNKTRIAKENQKRHSSTTKFSPNGRITKIYRNFEHHKTLSSSEPRYSYNNRRNRKYS